MRYKNRREAHACATVFLHSKRTQSDGAGFTTRKHAALYQQGITSVALTLSSVGVMSYLLGLVLAGSPVGPAGRGELGLDGWPRLGAGIWRGWLGADAWACLAGLAGSVFF